MLPLTFFRRLDTRAVHRGVGTIMLLLASAWSAAIADGPQITCVPAAPSAGPTTPVLGPTPPPDWIPFTFAGELVLLHLHPTDPSDKGSTLIDLGNGLGPAAPNALERAKLEMATRAIEESRAAGTLYFETQVSDGTPSGTAPEKVDTMRGAPATPPDPDPAACIGDLPSLQVPGTGDLTPSELEKIRAVLGLTDRATPERKEGN